MFNIKVCSTLLRSNWRTPFNSPPNSFLPFPSHHHTFLLLLHSLLLPLRAHPPPWWRQRLHFPPGQFCPRLEFSATGWPETEIKLDLLNQICFFVFLTKRGVNPPAPVGGAFRPWPAFPPARQWWVGCRVVPRAAGGASVGASGSGFPRCPHRPAAPRTLPRGLLCRWVAVGWASWVRWCSRCCGDELRRVKHAGVWECKIQGYEIISWTGIDGRAVVFLVQLMGGYF